MSAFLNPPRNGEGDRRSRWRGRRLLHRPDPSTIRLRRTVPLPVPGRIRRERGFTLVELMVVLVILGLLATIVLINVMPALGRAKTETARASVRQLEQAIDTYSLNNGRYPTREEGLQALVAGRLLKRLDPDPWGNAFVYRIPGRNGQPYNVLSLGADGREGGTGDNADIAN